MSPLSPEKKNSRYRRPDKERPEKSRYRLPAAGAGFVRRNAGFAPARGRNFCPPPLSTSATYTLPSVSTLIPCTPQKAPGNVPHVPQEYWKLPFRSYLIIFDVARSNAHRWREPSM